MAARADHESETFGQRLRRLRRDRGLRQEDLTSAGVSAAYVSRLESGERTASPKVVHALAAALGVTAQELAEGQRDDPHTQRELRLADAELALRFEDLDTATSALRELLADATRAGDADVAAQARAALGLAAFQRGRHAEAVEHFEAAVVGGRLSPSARPDVHATLARSYVSLGQTARAVEILEGCLAQIESERPVDWSAYIRFATYLSYAFTDMGEIGSARRVLSKALEQAGDVEDPYAQVRLYWSQARLAAAEHQTPRAVAYLRRAIALLEATEDRRQVGRAHLLWAEILTFDGDEQAGPHLEAAERLLGPQPDAEDLYWLRTEQARWAATFGAFEEAVARAREALSLIGDEDPAERGAALWALGEGLAGLGDREASADALRESLDALSGQRVWREALQVARALARVLRLLDRFEEAFEVLERTAAAAAGSAEPARPSRVDAHVCADPT